MKCILIGKDAGKELTNETHQLILKSESIDLHEKMTEREYYLISSLLKCYIENETGNISYGMSDYKIFHSGCSACRTGNCSVHIGYKTGRL